MSSTINISIKTDLRLSKAFCDSIIKHVKPTMVLDTEMYDVGLIADAIGKSKDDFTEQAKRFVESLLDEAVDFIELP